MMLYKVNTRPESGLVGIAKIYLPKMRCMIGHRIDRKRGSGRLGAHTP